MSRNGTGTYTLPAGNPVVTGTTISSTWANNSLSDIATALTQSLAKDGQTVPTANIPMGGFKITGLGAPTTAGDALAYGSSLGPVTATTGTFSGNVQMASLNGGQLAGLRNRIINGDMRVAQRGTSFVTSGTNTAFPADRFLADYSSGATVTVSQQADAPSSNEFQYSIRAAVGTADTSIGVAEYWYIQQKIEGFNARDLIGKTFTLSFWVKSSKTGIHCVSFRNAGNDRSYVVEYTVSVANTWEQKSITVAGGLITAGTWNWTNGVGLGVSWALAIGSNFHTTAGAWQTGNFFSTANQVNCLDSNTNIFAITAAQLEVGPVATPFEQRPIGMELALCQRYYYRIYAITGTGGFHQAQVNTTVQAAGMIPFPVQMRTNPTALEQSGTATDYRVNFASTNITCSAVPLFNGATNYNNGYVLYTVASGLTAGQSCGIIANSTNAYLGWSAEL
jgi:hypothetical protein